MAILLGAFIIQGIVPGPDLLNPAKHLTLTFSFVWIIVITNIITVAICFLFLNQLAKITFIKGTYLIPLLLLLIYLGGFAVKNSFGDIFMVLLFGTIGWFMVKFDWQRPPLLLGLVLGGIAETNLFIASRIYGFTWLWHPGVLVIGAIILFGTFYPYLQTWFKGRSSVHDASETPKTVQTRVVRVPMASRITASVFALLIVGVFAYVVYQSVYGFGAFEPRSAFFPWAIGMPCLILAIYVFSKEVLTPKKVIKTATAYAAPEEPEIEPIIERQRTFAIGCWIVGFFIAIFVLGFIPASAIATFLYLKFGAGERWPVTLAITVGCWLFFFALFDYALQMPVPQGALFEWLPVKMANLPRLVLG
jgi:hypothetical protein